MTFFETQRDEVDEADLDSDLDTVEIREHRDAPTEEQVAEMIEQVIEGRENFRSEFGTDPTTTEVRLVNGNVQTELFETTEILSWFGDEVQPHHRREVVVNGDGKIWKDECTYLGADNFPLDSKLEVLEDGSDN